MVNISLSAFSAYFSALGGYGAYIISRVKTAVVCGGELLLSCYLQASVQSLQVATVSRMLYWRVLLNWRLPVSVEKIWEQSDLWTLNKNRRLAWTTTVLKTPEPWCSRWRVHVTHRRADDSRVQVWLESFPNSVPIFGPLEIQEGTAGSEICVCV